MLLTWSPRRLHSSIFKVMGVKSWTCGSLLHLWNSLALILKYCNAVLCDPSCYGIFTLPVLLFLQQSRKRKRGKVFTPCQQKTKSCKPSTPCTPVTSGSSSINTPSPSGVLPGTLAKKVSSSASKAAESLARFQMTASPTPSSNVDKEGGEGSYTHEKLDWLKEDKRR